MSEERSTERAEDDAIVARFRAGDRRAFDELVQRHQAPIRQMVLRYVKNEDDAKDIAQKAFVRAFEGIAGFRGEAAFRTWLYRIAVNLALNHVRGGAGANMVPLEDIAGFTTALETAKLVAAEVWRKVSARLDELPPKQRLVFELRTFHNLTFDEIAAIVDSSEDSAKVNYHHALRRIRASLPPPG